MCISNLSEAEASKEMHLRKKNYACSKLDKKRLSLTRFRSHVSLHGPI